jgi:hypothetical protein
MHLGWLLTGDGINNTLIGVYAAQVKFALGAKHVIRVCSSKDQDKVIRAAQRLLDNASVIRAAVDLSGEFT